MAVKLRLRRMGRKKRPFYRIVATDSRMPRDGRFLETVGTYDPLETPHKIELKEDRIYYWLGNGAQPSQTVKDLFRHKGLWLKWDLMKRGADETRIAEEFSKWQLLQDEKAKRLAAKKAQADKEKKKTAEAKDEEVKAEAAPVAEAAPEPETEQPAEAPAVEEKAPAAEETPAEKTAAEQAAPAAEEVPAEQTAPEKKDQEEAGE